jgi:hypothetical protein
VNETKKKYLVVIVKSEIYPITVDALNLKEAEQLATVEYESKNLDPADTYFYVEDVLEEN